MPIVSNDMGKIDGDLSSLQGSSLSVEAKSPRGRRLLHVVTNFLVGQGATQGVSVLAALFLVRHMSVDAYAQFSLTIGFQTVFASLMDMGFASTIVPMVGERRDDHALVGRYVRSAKHLRDRAFWILSPIAVAAFIAIMHKQHWSWSVQFALICSVLLSLYSSGTVSYYSAPLFLYGRLPDYYVPQVITGAGRLVIYVGLRFFGGLNAWSAAGLSALNISIVGGWLSRKSRPLLKWPDRDDPTTDRETLRYILPAAPAIIFSAFQSQITLFLISIFGGTVLIANVAALSRIAQLFSVLMTFYIVIIEPYIARLNRQRLLPTFAGLVLLATLVFVPIVWIAFTWPKVFLWMLGPKYEGLYGLVGWVILSACMNSVAGLMWIMNRARKWVFWSGAVLEVALVLVVQFAFVIFIGVHSTREAVLLSFASSFCYLVAHSYVSVFGFLKDRRSRVEI